MDMVSTLHNFRGSRPKPSSSARPTLWHCGERKTNCCSVSPPTGQHEGEEMDVDERGQRTPFCHRHTERRGTPHKEIPHAHIISPFHENALTPTTANNPSAFPHCSLLSSPPLFFATVWTRKASPPPPASSVEAPPPPRDKTVYTTCVQVFGVLTLSAKPRVRPGGFLYPCSSGAVGVPPGGEDAKHPGWLRSKAHPSLLSLSLRIRKRAAGKRRPLLFSLFPLS